jgi:hypothetical protein
MVRLGPVNLPRVVVVVERVESWVLVAILQQASDSTLSSCFCVSSNACLPLMQYCTRLSAMNVLSIANRNNEFKLILSVFILFRLEE